MSRKYKSLTGLELLKAFCAEVLAYGIREGLDLDGVKIWVSSDIAQSLELSEFLSIEIENHIYEVPIIVNPAIRAAPLDEGKFQTEIYAGDPDWEINMAEGNYEPNC